VPGYETFMAADGVVLSNTVITHVPISSKAVEEVKQMIPSLNILSPKNDSHNISYDQEYMAGLAAGSMLGQRTNKSYKTVAQATEAYNKGEIRINDQIKVGNKRTTLGRLELTKILPKEL